MCRAAQEFRATLDAMREVLAALAAAPAKQASALPGAASVRGNAAWAARWAGGWARWALAPCTWPCLCLWDAREMLKDAGRGLSLAWSMRICLRLGLISRAPQLTPRPRAHSVVPCTGPADAAGLTVQRGRPWHAGN